MALVAPWPPVSLPASALAWRWIAMDRAIRYVGAAILAAPEFGEGHGPIGHALGTTPYHHLKAAEKEGEWGVEVWDSLWAPERTKH